MREEPLRNAYLGDVTLELKGNEEVVETVRTCHIGRRD